MPAGSRSERYGRFEIRLDERQLLVDGHPAPLGARAFDVLATLAGQRGRVVGKDELLARVWPGLVVEENNIQVQISALRKLLGAQAITTVPGRGYQFTLAPDAPPAERDAAAGRQSGPAAHGLARIDGADTLPAADGARFAGGEALLGREADIEALEAALASHRLVTVAGAGGIGKTRLAREVAHRLAPRHADGTAWVDLAALASADALAPAIAAAARVPLGAGEATPLLARALAHREVLLVLDNAEHLVAALASLLPALLAAAPGLHLVVTSQEPLQLRGELVHRLDALAVPPEGASIAEARRFAALQLLEQRAAAADRRFALDEATVAGAIELVCHLDGLPLAIEMAAARLPLLGLEALNGRLGERLRLLRGAGRDAPPRQQTLRATLDWSHSLLSAAEQVVLRRLAVCAGSITFETARQVAGDGTPTAPLDEWAVIEALSGLVAKSVLQLLPGAADAPPRYRLPETVRLYAGERLHEACETQAAEQRHGQALAAQAEAAAEASWNLPDAQWLGRYHADAADIALAFDRAVRRQDVVVAVNTARVLRLLDGRQGVVSEERRRLEALRDLMPLAEGALRARVLGQFAGQTAVAGVSRPEAMREAVAIRRREGPPRSLYTALADLARECARAGDHAAADAAIAEAEAAEDPAWPPRVRWKLAEVRKTVAAMRGDAWPTGTGTALRWRSPSRAAPAPTPRRREPTWPTPR
ncbi:MAG: winged helix-turn-helix domain-containing protein [Rubrivivax sp.]|nr:winged helix-turn-helix domain-containing protein [Rubrivivax sp.]